TRGSEVTMRPLPSLVTRTMLPVSAIAKFAPVMPRSAWRNFSRSSPRAIFVSTSGSAATVRRSSLAKRSATWPLVLWIAGAMMCDGRSWASWMMYSPRSVSTGVIPACSSASLRWISSEALDVVDQLLEVAIEVLERRLLDFPRHVAELLPLREVAERLAAEPDELGRRDGQRLLEKRILHRVAGALAERDREVGLAHAPP